MRGWRASVSIAATLAAAVAAILATPLAAQERTQARSMVISQYGIVAAEQPIAARAGTAILEAGGNAIDAAVAANAAMGLVAPMMNGIGGDLFAIVYDAKTEEGLRPQRLGLGAEGADPRISRARASRMDARQRHPFRHGAGRGRRLGCAAARFGSKRFADVLAPAIAGARRPAFRSREIFADDWDDDRRLSRCAMRRRRRYYLPGGRVPEVGEIFRNPDLAARPRGDRARRARRLLQGTLSRKRILDTSAQARRHHAADDLAEFAPEWVEPISTDYRGWTVYEMPPNEQGIAALMMLNIMSTSPLGQWGAQFGASPARSMIEAKKLAYADMIALCRPIRALPRCRSRGMISAAYGRKPRGADRSRRKANCDVGPGTPPYAGSDTTYLSTVDRDGNMVSLIQSNYSLIGAPASRSRAAASCCTIAARCSRSSPAIPTCWPARKRPLHTIIPALMTKGDVRIAFGIMGGFNQAQAHAQFVSNVVDHGMNIQAAMEARALFQGELCRLRPLHRGAGAGRRSGPASAKLGHRLQDGRRLFRRRRRRPGGDARRRGRRELRRLRSAQGRPGDRGNAGAAVTGGGPGEQRQLGKLAHNSIRSRRLRPMRRRSAKRWRIVGSPPVRWCYGCTCGQPLELSPFTNAEYQNVAALCLALQFVSGLAR